MKRIECEFESDVLLAVVQSRFPGHVSAELRGHVESCAICRDLACSAAALAASREELASSAMLPDASVVWRRARLRARREAVLAAGRPITAVQVLALALAVGLLGACFGATSMWFQSALKAFGAYWTSATRSSWFSAASLLIAEHAALCLVGLGILLVLPTALLFALERD